MATTKQTDPVARAAIAQLAWQMFPSTVPGQTAVPLGMAAREQARLTVEAPALVALLSEYAEELERRPAAVPALERGAVA